MNWIIPHIHVLLPLTIALILGISWQVIDGSFWWPYSIFCSLFVTIIFFYKDTKKSQKNSIILLAILSAFCVGAVSYYHQHKKFLNFYYATIETPLDVVGTVADIDCTQNDRYPQIITLAIHEACRKDIRVPEAKNQTIKLYLDTPVNTLVGDTLECKNIFLRKCTNNSYQQYLIKEHIAATVFLKSATITVTTNPQFSLSRWLHEKRKIVVESLRIKMSDLTFSLFSTIFLGYKNSDQESRDQINNNFKIWGIVHYLARSGLHLVLFVMLWKFLFNWLPITFFIKELLMVGLVAVYLAFSWSTISFTRALITFLLYKLCILLDLPINPVHILTLACCAILLYNPFQLLFLDFQLSFALTFALAWFNEVTKLIKRKA